MTAQTKHGLIKKQGLTPEELTQIEQLATICNEHEGLELKLNMSMLHRRPENETNDFLYYENGELVGFLPLFVFNSNEAEVSGMVHPEHRRKGIFRTMLAEGAKELQARNNPKIILIVENASQSGLAFAKAVGTEYAFSEYKMELKEAKEPQRLHDNLILRPAVTEDSPFLAKCVALAFNMPEKDVNWMKVDEPDKIIYVIERDGEQVGTMSTNIHEENKAFLYGFAMMPDQQGKGYGRQMLGETIRLMIEQGRPQIELEVAVANKNALGLYQSCGFELISAYDYYAIPTEALAKGE